MDMKFVAKSVLVAGALAGGLALSGNIRSVEARDITLQMAAPDWLPTRFLQEEANRNYRAKSGNNVKIEVDFIPWPSFFDRVAASLTSGEQKYEMVVTDSQWLGTFIEGGHFLKLNKHIDADPELQAIMKDVHPAMVEGYSTYPHKSANYYGFPQMPDTQVVWYREDLFCNAGEKAAFKAQFDLPLPCTYEDWQDVDWNTWEAIGKFFRRSSGEKLGDGVAENDFYGTAYQAGKAYDSSVMQINAFLWQWGGGIWDEANQPKARAEGVVNSASNVAAFERYLDLLQYSPPVAKTGQMDLFAIQELFMQGKVAAIIDWAALAPSAVDPEASLVADKAAFAQPPGKRNGDGEIDRWYNLGGQPFVLTTWNDDEVVAESLEFVKWWLSEEVQVKFAKAGGQSGLQSVMDKPEYNSFAPWNRAHVEMIAWQKDFWHVPEFFELLTQHQEEADKAITGQKTAKEALDAIAAYQEDLLIEVGRIQ